MIVLLSKTRREGSQETIINKSRTSTIKIKHSTFLLISNTLDYNSRYSIFNINNNKNRQGLILRNRGFIRFKHTDSASLANSVNLKLLNPWFITGFSDAEGCFMVDIVKSSTLRIG